MTGEKKGKEPITAGPWSSGRIAALHRLRWNEPLPDGTTHARQEVFETREEAEEYKRELEATGMGIEVRLG
jgi:hypothetical protein